MGANGHAEMALAVSTTPAELLHIAVTQNADLDKLTKLMELQERWERNEARKAFVAAMNAFKSEPVRIVKNGQVGYEGKRGGPTNYNYATLDHVCDAVIGGLSKHGISHRWTVKQEGEWIKVTCVLRHALGHEEETTLMGTADQTGSKNSIQAIGSTVTYLQRYTLLAATGLAAAEQDTDGRVPAQSNAIPADRIEEMCGELNRASDLAQLKKVFAYAYREAEQAKDRSAMAAYIRAKDARKRELQ